MTATQRRQSAGKTANPKQGVRIERLPGRPLRQTGAGRVALPLWVLSDGIHVGDGDLVLTHDEATTLHAELGRFVTDAEPEQTASGDEGA
ncbi:MULTISPECIES: hypothetical protein [unclassified Streptomyces]|uniref:Uncharacterized protein n=2 Tax=Caudoviricetes TaxID=2731619 RepID=A0A0K1Y5Y2_9CAUD|nr:hypothetical protein [Streptomyces sp. SPB78]YP_009199295.1 hypothetical protein AVV13_gp47 [Streptomyces phage SF1]YP_009213154.1 hypothetical protein AVV12_gp27 [Streptomyces phage SF3]AKY02196.1 hypothetical protein SF1_470 [Streptomyces phage SF1]ALF00158.1 hypothetical protein SF3_270 [Streptomyces phage SF3]EFL00567.1 predicted protein [Streptomyces sp. SPB78]